MLTDIKHLKKYYPRRILQLGASVRLTALKVILKAAVAPEFRTPSELRGKK